MMNRGELQSSLVQQMVWSSGGGGGTNNTNIMSSSLRPCPHEEQEASLRMPPLSSPSALFSQQLPHISAGLAPSLHDGQEGSMPAESWSQLLLGGLVGDHERYSTTALLSKGLENWGDQGASASSMVDVKEESSMAHAAAYSFYGHGNTGHEEIQAAGANKPQLSQMLLASSPRSCITTNLGSSMLDFSNGAPPELRNHHSDNSSECNSTAAAGSALKKARVQASSSAQSTLKVRKERLGDRITALHQIVSPFGKTDTASVLQETIGYIRFLLGQIEALSYPYLGHGTAGNSMQTGPAGERSSGRYPENPGQLLNNASAQAGQSDQQGENNGEARKDLRSRGLCLVPVSCTSHFGGDNGSDIWAPVQLGGILR